MMFVDVLPAWERCTYWTLVVSAFVYSAYSLFVDGDRYKTHLSHQLAPGWEWLGRHQDKADPEWYVWKSGLTAYRLLTVAAHIVVSQICFYFKVTPKLHTWSLVIVDLASAYLVLGLRPLAYLVSSTLLVYAACRLGKVWLVWLLGLALLASATEYFLNVQVELLQLSLFTEQYLFAVTASFFYIRLISFGVDKVQHGTSRCARNSESHGEERLATEDVICNSTAESDLTSATRVSNSEMSASKLESINMVTETSLIERDPSLADLLLYTFYSPTFYFGPIFTYRDFHRDVGHSFGSKHFTPDICDIFKQLVRLAFWAIFIELQIHFLYYRALTQLVSTLPLSNWTMAITGFLNFQHIVIKLSVIYGIPIQLGRFDGIQPLASTRGFCWIYSYTDTWKHVDVGWYNFQKNYIYIPLGGSRAGLCRPFLTSGVAMLFLVFFHGLEANTLIWGACCYICSNLERIASLLETSATGNRLKSHVSPTVYLRLKAVAIVPWYLVFLATSTSVYLGQEFALVFLSRLVWTASWMELLVLSVVVYAVLQNSFLIKQWHSYKQKDGSTEGQASITKDAGHRD